MFSIIVVIISIALVAALTLATVYFGGDTFLKGKPDAEAARYINEGQQVSAAIRLYQVENQGLLPKDLEADLVGHYLKDLPEAGANWDIASDAIVKAISDADTCEAVNKRAGWNNPNWPAVEGVSQHEPVSCEDPALDGRVYYCCTVPGADSGVEAN